MTFTRKPEGERAVQAWRTDLGTRWCDLAHDRRGRERRLGINSAVYLPPTNLGQEPDTLTSIPTWGRTADGPGVVELHLHGMDAAGGVFATAGYYGERQQVDAAVGVFAQTTIPGGRACPSGNISVGNACVVIRDTQTYSEQVNIPVSQAVELYDRQQPDRDIA